MEENPMTAKAFQELSSLLMLPDSGRMARIWELIVDETDAGLLLAMPGTVPELAGKSQLPEQEVESRLGKMYRKGVVFESTRPEGTIFRPPRHLIQFHDASNQWPEAPVAFYDLWKEFMHEEFPRFLAMVLSTGFPSFMRTVPTLQAIETLGGVDPWEDVDAMIAEADSLAVCRCPCRLEERSCDSLVERCIQMGKGAEYAIKRGTGRSLTREEAHELLLKSGENGLVHLVENTKKLGKVICNCCDCCCAIIRPARTDPDCRKILAPSRFLATIDPERCTGDGLCAHVCPMEAVSVDEETDLAVVDPDLCIGCGVCLGACQENAIELQMTRTPDFIPE
jgi:Pyruvate/2-oxoacid:ferredoxin oxidoreductase delta subunit